jgi:hypothetical protein
MHLQFPFLCDGPMKLRRYLIPHPHCVSVFFYLGAFYSHTVYFINTCTWSKSMHPFSCVGGYMFIVVQYPVYMLSPHYLSPRHDSCTMLSSVEIGITYDVYVLYLSVMYLAIISNYNSKLHHSRSRCIPFNLHTAIENSVFMSTVF